MPDKPDWQEVRRQPFLYLALITALGAIACAVWWEDTHEESSVAVALALAAWEGTGLLAFVSGYRLERREWDVSPLGHGLLTAFVALGATFGAMFIAAYIVISAQSPTAVGL